MLATGAEHTFGITAFGKFPEKGALVFDKVIGNKIGFQLLLKLSHLSFGLGEFFMKVGTLLRDNLELVFEEKQSVTKNAG
jgi:hypothetical protein